MFQPADPIRAGTPLVMPVPAGRDAAPSARGLRTALYVLALMSAISLLGAYDRYLVGILVQNIKHDLGASDGQLGLLTGLGFALVYSLLAVPVARLSDRGRRVPVLACSMLLWSAMSALCGLAASMPMLLMARLGVGIGEAGCVPTTQAIISDHFPDRWRATAIAIATVASGVGLTVASVGGGWLADHWGWRSAFLAGAAPGPVLAWLLWSTIRSPTSVSSVASSRAEAPQSTSMGMGQAVSTLFKVRSLRLICIGYAISTMAAYASIAWVPAYLMRTYGLTAGRVGASYGSITGITMIIALFGGGLLGDLLAQRNQRWLIWQMAACALLACPLTLAFLFAGSFHLAVLIAIPMTVACMANGGTTYAIIQELAGPRLRATGSALFLLCYNLLGVGVGPSLVGWLSDGLSPSFGTGSLRYALAITSFTYVVGGTVIAFAVTTIRQDSATAASRGGEPAG